MTLLLVVALFPGVDPEPDSIPKGPPPRIAVLSAAQLYSTARTTYTVPRMIEDRVPIMVGRRMEVKIVRRPEMNPPLRIERAVNSFRATTAAGRKLDREAALRALALPRVVLISSDGKAVDPAYLKLVRPDTPVLILFPAR